MGLIKYAEKELNLLSGEPPDEMQERMNRHILAMVKLFAEERHSGFSAAYAVSVLEKLLRFEPLTPLTGADEEWIEVGPGLWQNRRCSRIFKEADGRAYDSEGRIFVDPDGSASTNRNSRVYIEFPYRPKKEYVKRSDSE